MGSEFNLPRNPRTFSLGNFALRLDPAIRAEIEAMRTGLPSPRLRALILRPNWRLFDQSHLERALAEQPSRVAPPLVPRGRYEGTPRAAEVGQLAEALWQVPAVQQAAERVLHNVGNTLRQSWNRAPTGHKALIISHSALIGGALLTTLMSNQSVRTDLLDLLSDSKIPVPGVHGLELQLRHNSQSRDYGVIVNFDLGPYIP